MAKDKHGFEFVQLKDNDLTALVNSTNCYGYRIIYENGKIKEGFGFNFDGVKFTVEHLLKHENIGIDRIVIIRPTVGIMVAEYNKDHLVKEGEV